MSLSPNQVIDAVLRQFAKTFVANRRRDVKSRDLLNTDALLQSLHAELSGDPNRAIQMMTFFAAGYGRYQDMRRNYNRAGGTDMVQALEAWAEQEGLAKFQKGKYAGLFQRKPPERVLNAIAWGIIRKYKNKPPRKRSWYNSGKTKDIEQFYDRLLNAYRVAVLAEMKTAAQG